MAYINGKEVLFSTVLTKWGVVQTKGDSVNEVMSQKAVTDELYALGDKIDNIGCAIIVDNYSELVHLLDASSADDYRLGQNIYVRQSDVPDLWISDVDPDNQISYHYSTDEQFIVDINDAAALYRLNIGHYAVSVLETEKVDLSAYPTRTDMATSINNALVPTKADVADLKTKVSRTEKRIMNLEKGLPDDDFVTDSTSAYVREVPENALPFAEISEIGGVTRKCTNLIPSPYLSTVSNVNGVSVIVNENGTITFSGKCTSGWTFILCEQLMHAGNYYLADGVTETGINFLAYDIDNSEVVSWEGAFSLTKDTRVRVYYLVADTFNGNCVVSPMLNSGETALPYEPYFEGLRSAPVTEVVSEGVNLFGGEALANKIVEVAGGVIDEKSQTVRFLSTSINGKVLFDNFKPNTVYTFILSGWNTYGLGSNLLLQYTDGTVDYLAFTASQTHSVIVFKSNSTKSVKGLYGINFADYTYLYYNECGIFEGYINVEDFKPYIKRTLPIPEAVRPAHGIPNTDCFDRVRWRYDEATDKWVRESEKGVGVVDIATLTWRAASNNSWYTHALVGIAKPNVGLCDEYNVIPLTATQNAADKTLQIRDDIAYIKDASITDASQITGTLVYGLATPEITDISHLLPEDNLIGVEGGGTITMQNEYGYDVPAKITYQVEETV